MNLKGMGVGLLLGAVSAMATAEPVPIVTYQPNTTLVSPAAQKVVLVGGCFDILHYGHLQFLEKAKTQGDYLIVALEPDARIIKTKKRQPLHTQKQRAYNLSQLRNVDAILLLGDMPTFQDYAQLVKDVHPKIIAITADDPQWQNKQKQAALVGATVVVVTPRIGTFSSSKIVEKLSEY